MVFRKQVLYIGLNMQAQEFGSYGIRVNSISPGPFPKNKKNKRFIKILSDRTALKRIGKPIELVGPVSFLCSKILVM